jgi:photosystem II stability/assembly factor-like uncharacterized protein
LVAILLAVATAPAGAEEIPSRWTWTDYGPSMRDVSCGSPGDCVAVGQRGMVLHSSRDDDDSLAWAKAPIEYPEELAGVTCTQTFCLAVSNEREPKAPFESAVFRSEDGGKTWGAGVVLPEAGRTQSAVALSCDGDGACYAVGPAGGVWRSLDGGRSWAALGQSPKAVYEHVDCPAAELCVAVGNKKTGDSAVIEGTAVTPVALPKETGAGVLALACDSATRCTATDGLGHYMSMTIATKAWGAPRLFPGLVPPTVTSLSCPIENVCVGLAGGLALRTVDLSSPTGGWKRRPLGSLAVETIGCAREDCVAVGKAAVWFSSFDAGFSWHRINEIPKFASVQCGFGETCVAGGDKDIGVSRSGGKLWSLPLAGETGLGVESVNCSGPSECLFLGKTLALFSDDLVQFEERHPTLYDPRGTKALACVTKEICVGLNEGVVYTTLDAAKTPWTQNGFPETATSMACVKERLEPAECVATTREFLILGTMTHTDGKVRWDWRYTDAEPSVALEAVACSPGGQCTAVGKSGVLLTSDGTDLMHWNEHILLNESEVAALRPVLSSVACPADGECLVGGFHGAKAFLASTTNNWADDSINEFEGIEGAPALTAIGCKSPDRCVAVGSTSLVGIRKPAPQG